MSTGRCRSFATTATFDGIDGRQACNHGDWCGLLLPADQCEKDLEFDCVGSAETNQTLSERRAESVCRYLAERFDIDVARLEAAGLGQTRPVDSNDTPRGRQNNRRVELVRL